MVVQSLVVGHPAPAMPVLRSPGRGQEAQQDRLKESDDKVLKLAQVMETIHHNTGPLSPMLDSIQSKLFGSGPSNWSRRLSPDDQKKVDSDQEKGMCLCLQVS